MTTVDLVAMRLRLSKFAPRWRWAMAGVVVVLAVAWPLSAQQSPVITGAAVSGTTVMVAGSSLGGITGLSVGSVAATSVTVNSEGTFVTGTLPTLDPATYSLILMFSSASDESSSAPMR